MSWDDYSSPSGTKYPLPSRYADGSNVNVVVINDTTVESMLKNDPTALIMHEIKAKETTLIPSQNQSTKVRTNITIQGPIHSVNMHVKRHNDLPIAGVLVTGGFINPWERTMSNAKGKTLKVFMGNPKNYEIK